MGSLCSKSSTITRDAARIILQKTEGGLFCQGRVTEPISRCDQEGTGKFRGVSSLDC